MNSRCLTILALLAAAVVRPASAYVLQEDGSGHPLYWKNMPVSYFLVSNNAPGGAVGEDAIHRAFATWNGASANVSYRFGGHVAQGKQQYDGKNIVYWIYGGWPFDRSLAAVTFHYYDTRDGHLLDADIVFNGERFAWTVNGGAYDIENSAAHEVGHFGGLGHSPDPEATMYARTAVGETKKRTLNPDDVAGIEAIYGGTRDESTTSVAGTAGGSSGVSGGGGGGCAVAPGAARGDELLTFVFLFSLLLAARWRR